METNTMSARGDVMAEIRIKIELNKGRRGVFLHKLANIGQETEKYLRMLSEDVGLSISKGKWLAVDFENGSVAFFAECVEQASNEEEDIFNEAFISVADYDPTKDSPPSRIRPATLRQYAEIVNNIDDEESVGFGIHTHKKATPIEWKYLSKPRADAIVYNIDRTVSYHGAIQGRVHSLTKGVKPPYIDVRDLVTGKLIKCYFERNIYDDIVKILKDPDAVIHISGKFQVNKMDRKIECINIDKIVQAETFNESDIDNFIGCSPDITGDLSTGEAIRKIRDNG
jgi:hypothetical protein